MRLALLSDIHANAEALDACLRHARTSGRADAFCLLGDFVGYGADAAGVVDRVRSEVEAGAIAVKGNHDEALEGAAGYFNEQALAAIDWAKRTLDEAQKRFLASLPLIVRANGCCFVHASAAMPERWDYVDGPSAAARCVSASGAVHTFCGHVHDQRLYYETAGGRMRAFVPVPGTEIPVQRARRWLAIVGSVGQPRDRNPAAAYAMFDDERLRLTFHRVPYDQHGAAEKIRRAGLPHALAYRVEAGI